ncbi:uncharacterized protein MYCFIDRAFT_170538 [Pseudocercospora fijiensis CIRAD86]|uniref:Uncharacterized protein n=1 Tax=Pseudocercospora fijiensis (strain CIRAD86) TaxID=383855 RepID=N1Q840_PSEFD|nr:uncharacterized protein MYCFIDRAFT_170538 [Pseudocercospora fijiensis CIRAD86]EME89000.1 hypothetical protein MYCFIDRAFT_170538 [Pseudocercospora fijiensis CIRAD86]
MDLRLSGRAFSRSAAVGMIPGLSMMMMMIGRPPRMVMMGGDVQGACCVRMNDPKPIHPRTTTQHFEEATFTHDHFTMLKKPTMLKRRVLGVFRNLEKLDFSFKRTHLVDKKRLSLLWIELLLVRRGNIYHSEAITYHSTSRYRTVRWTKVCRLQSGALPILIVYDLPATWHSLSSTTLPLRRQKCLEASPAYQFAFVDLHRSVTWSMESMASPLLDTILIWPHLRSPNKHPSDLLLLDAYQPGLNDNLPDVLDNQSAIAHQKI